MRLEGIAYLPEPGEHPEVWEVPGELILRVEFDPLKVIGKAKLTKDRDGSISVTAEVPDGAVLLPTHGPGGAEAVRDVTRQVLGLCPKFALGVNDPESETLGRVVSVSVVSDNANPLIEPYERFEDEGEADAS